MSACTLFVINKKCVFICVPDKKAFDWIIIDNPENDMSIHDKLTDNEGQEEKRMDNSLQPLVTSIMPDIIPWAKLDGMPIISKILTRG